ncbi:cytochrome P450 [Exidia glandulosa HHB12029]|uniref:Cytochrome P450 n=1 Tax=Exidia glandulosa HHB12029 TaxID=1314781 RepID=A0A166A5B5_EXIGL|nr:cytochrome P450 [Exidia glandulosa HHB12029]
MEYFQHSNLNTDLVVCVVLGIIFVGFIAARLSTRARLPLPPGPPGQFFSGNAHQLPSGPGGRQYLEWSKSYGDVLHLRNWSSHIIVLNSEKAIRDLFARRAENYSDRVQTPMYCDPSLVDRGKTVFSTNYGERFRRYSKLLHQALSKSAIAAYEGVQAEATDRMLTDIARKPEAFVQHIRACTTRIILKVAYGYDLTVPEDGGEDYFVKLVEESIALGNESFKPGRWLVNSFPILRHVPEWMPGAGFKRWARGARVKLHEMTRAPIEMVKQQMAEGTAAPSFVSRNLEEGADQETLTWVAAALYVGGADTTVAALSTFVLLMVRYPEVQRKAQAELAALGRLPTAEDRPRLPYVEAVMKECMRYNTIGPMALAHCARREDEYAGIRIPRGATVYSNIWAVTRDERIYSDPEVFRPERFIGEKAERDPWDIIFGFGLRRCPGRYLADATLFIAIAKLLAAFEFRPEVDAAGRETIPLEQWTSGPNCGPKPFQCQIIARPNEALLSL